MNYVVDYDAKQVNDFLADSHDLRIKVGQKWVNLSIRGEYAYFAPDNCQETLKEHEYELLCWLYSMGVRRVRIYKDEEIKSIKDESNFSYINGEKCIILKHKDATGIYQRYYDVNDGTLTYEERSDEILRESLSSYFKFDIEAGIPEDYYIIQETRSIPLRSASIQGLDVHYLTEVGHRPIKQGIKYRERPKVVSGIYKI